MAEPEYVTHPELNQYIEKIRQIAMSENKIQNDRIRSLEEDLKKLSATIVSMQLESREILALVKNTDGNITNLSGTIFAELKEAKEERRILQTRTEGINLMKQAVYGFIGLILIAVVGAVIAQVVGR